MARGGNPVAHERREGFGGHAGVGCHHHLGQSVHARSHNPTHIAFEHGLERLLVTPFGVLRRQCLDTIEHEAGLDGHRLFDPQRAVIVEHGDPIDRPHEIGVANGRHARHEIEDRPLGCAVAPCGQSGITSFRPHPAASQRFSSRAAVPNGPSW